MTVSTETARIVEAVDTPPALDARHFTWQLAHLLKVHGYLPDAQRAMSRDSLPALALQLDGHVFLVTVEEL